MWSYFMTANHLHSGADNVPEIVSALWGREQASNNGILIKFLKLRVGSV